jgi:hypothetical protein
MFSQWYPLEQQVDSISRGRAFVPRTFDRGCCFFRESTRTPVATHPPALDSGAIATLDQDAQTADRDVIVIRP